MEQQYKYFAFISYNSKDTKWGYRVQKKLESYRMPAELCSRKGWKRKPIAPVFFAPTDIQPSGLDEELQARLRASRHLIVICSPNSAKSKWVGKEIEYFFNLGRQENIHFFIVEGTPHSGNEDTECFNPICEELGMPEILGANIHEKVSRWPWINKERAYVQLITKLLGVEFDSIWQRHKRMLIQKFVTLAIALVTVLSIIGYVWASNQPFNTQVKLQEMSFHNNNLPPLKNAILTISLDKETKTDTIASMDEAALFEHIPHSFLGKKVHVRFVCEDYVTLDTTMELKEKMVLPIHRDASIYGHVHFQILSITGSNLAGQHISVGGHGCVTDKDGKVSIDIPLPEQQGRGYPLKSSLSLINDTIYVPCNEVNIVEVK